MSALWSVLTSIARSSVLSLFQRITVGKLTVVLENGEELVFPNERSEEQALGSTHGVPDTPNATLRVQNDIFWIRVFTMSDLGFGEAYMYGDVECDDLTSFFHLFLKNKESLSAVNSFVSSIVSVPQNVITSLLARNTTSRSKLNIAAHYDISNEMFAAFLSKDMTYSCAIFPDLDADLKSGAVIHEDDLHNAQLRKINHHIKNLRIPAPDVLKLLPTPYRVLDIGTGWGEMAIQLAIQHPDVLVDTITLSEDQVELATKRIAERGLSVRIKVHLMDYRAMPVHWKGAFKGITCVGVLEHIGEAFLPDLGRMLSWALDKDTGIASVHGIMMPEGRFQAGHSHSLGFVTKWSELISLIFPGGYLPSLRQFLNSIASGSCGQLETERVVNIGPHYARTLREWERRFVDRFDSTIAPTLREQWEDGGRVSQKILDDEIQIIKRRFVYTVKLALIKRCCTSTSLHFAEKAIETMDVAPLNKSLA